MISLQGRCEKHRQNQVFSIRGGLLLEKLTPKSYFTGLRGGILCSWEFYRTAIIKNNPNDASSYPAIDPVTVDMSKYNTVIIATPLWWSQMASNMQTFLFKYGNEMAGKNIGLIVSSHSSGISSVEADAKRLVPNGKFYAKSLWINASKHSQRKALLEQWLKDVDFNTTGVASISANQTKSNSIYALNGQKLAEVPAKGMYIEDGVKKLK